MNKRGQVVVIIIIAVLAVAGIVIWQVTKRNSEEGNSNKTDSNVKNITALQLNCSELNLVIEKVDCLENITEISITVSRGEDSLGEGELTVYATDKNEKTKSNKTNIKTSETSKLTIKDIEIGAKTKVTIEFEITKGSQKAFCPGPIKEYICTGETEAEEETPSEPIPPPSGKIKATDQRDDANGGYFCNYTEKPEHAIKLYTYKNINGVKNFSSSCVESDKINNACANYADIINESTGMRYNMIWEWNAVEGIDGYRLYQYYSYNDTKIEYDYYIDLPPSYTKLTDTGFNLWKHEVT